MKNLATTILLKVFLIAIFVLMGYTIFLSSQHIASPEDKDLVNDDYSLDLPITFNKNTSSCDGFPKTILSQVQIMDSSYLYDENGQIK